MPNDIYEWSVQYLDHCEQVLDSPAPVARFVEHGSDELIYLSSPTLEKTAATLTQALLQRKTSRDFSGSSVTFNDLSTLLYLSLGYLKEREADTDETIPIAFRSRRSSPSGGGLSACEGYMSMRPGSKG